MVSTLAPMSTLIEERRTRLSYLLSVLKSQGMMRVPLETIFRRVAGAPERYYAVGTWDLFRTDLDFLEEHDCLIIRDNNILVTLPVEST